MRWITLALSVLLGACSSPISNLRTITILSPENQKIVDLGSVVVFKCISQSPDVLWVSNLQGEIGRGRLINAELIEGSHIISANCPNADPVSLNVFVKRLNMDVGQMNFWSLAREQNKIFLPSGEFQGVAVRFGTSKAQIALPALDRPREVLPGPSSRFLVNMVNQLPKIQKGISQDKVQSRFANTVGENISTRTFKVVDPSKSIVTPGWLISAKKVFSCQGLEIWLDNEAPTGLDLSNFFEVAQGLIFPRAVALWGPCSDEDQNQSLIVLLTKKFNDQRLAIGFFNPADLLPFNNDSSSLEYNPNSNEGEILYLGIPETITSDYAFSIKSLLATMAHEYQHLVHFSQKTLPQIKRGNPNPPLDDLFLDEGMSHLTESLVGLGVSGGNLAFVKEYFNKTQSTSLVFGDALGREDSVGKRGMAAAFLWYFYIKNGGGDWSHLDQSTFTDGGGLTALKRIITTDEVGMNAITIAGGVSFDTLFLDWTKQVTRWLTRLEPRPVTTFDKRTGEINSLSGFEGDFLLPNGQLHTLVGPVRQLWTNTFELLPYSIQWGNQYLWASPWDLRMITNKTDGLTFLGLMKIAD